MPSTEKSINDSEKEAASQKVIVRTVATEKTERAREMKEEKKSTETGAQLTPVKSLSYDDLAELCHANVRKIDEQSKKIDKQSEVLDEERRTLEEIKRSYESLANVTKRIESKIAKDVNDCVDKKVEQINQIAQDVDKKVEQINQIAQDVDKKVKQINQDAIKQSDLDSLAGTWKENFDKFKASTIDAINKNLNDFKSQIGQIGTLQSQVDKLTKSNEKPRKREPYRPSLSSIKKPLIITLIVLAILSVIVIPPACLFTDPVYHANVDRVNIGDDKDRVLRVLGAPDNGNQGSKHFKYYSSDHSVVDGKESGKSTKVDFNTQGFVTELVYDHDINNASKPIEKVETEYEGELRAFAETLVKYTVKYDDKSIYKSSVKIMPDNNGNLQDVFEYTFTVDDAFSDTPIEITLDVYNDVAETVRREGYLRVYKDFTGYRVSSIGGYVLFGEYPQTIKSDDVEVGEVADKDGYYLGSDGCRYAKVEASGGYVIEFSNGDEMKDETYYFKVEPICWRICESDGEKWYLLCDSVIDYRQYDLVSNDYKFSYIRRWLNDDFYNVAFTPQQQGYIAVTEVDNSAESTGYSNNPYACKNTSDKIFLPSYAEINEYDGDIDFAHYASSVRNDHNLALGNMGSNILLRSPYAYATDLVRCIEYDETNRRKAVFNSDVDNYYQIVPALNLKWNKSAA